MDSLQSPSTELELKLCWDELSSSSLIKVAILASKRLVESRGDIIPRPSRLDLGVRVSPHPAPDVLGLRLYSCGDNRGSFREPLEDYLFSNYYGNHLHDADVPFHRLAFLDHISHIYGFAVLKL